jgi:hypothetical protein
MAQRLIYEIIINRERRHLRGPAQDSSIAGTFVACQMWRHAILCRLSVAPSTHSRTLPTARVQTTTRVSLGHALVATKYVPNISFARSGLAGFIDAER